MIPRDYISEWRAVVPWVQDFQVEQDLVISRAVVEIFCIRCCTISTFRRFSSTSFTSNPPLVIPKPSILSNTSSQRSG